MAAVVPAAAVLGLLLTVIGVVTGIVMAAHRVVVDCPDGHYFPAGTTDFDCYSYPHAGQGVSIAVLAAMLGIVIGLLCLIASRLLTPPVDPPPAGALDE